tara:strand:+ start:49775 stop:54214 length:4440 start_codon:yes stop_codon:yes gene_type:complete
MGFNEIKKQYERGSVVELKVQRKLVDPQLIIFDLNGASARLHISNFSNSPVLSEKLFNIIREGELITLVIIDFNEEKEYVELSLKPFRNQLEGSLSFTKCRNVIDERKKMRIELPGDILEENRNQLDRIQGDLAKVDLTFLYELIQNAIDHPNPNFHNLLSIKFEVYNDYLLLKHNGSIFTENNFKSLTGILLGEKDTGEERIGYKGIGFKSIFRYTQEVYIRSGNFSFSFSKVRSGAKMPWEVIPIFENEIDKVEEIKNFEFFNTPVAFAFKFTNSELRERAIKYLEQLVSSPETLLFLNKLARLEIVVNKDVKRITRQVKDYTSHQVITLQLDEQKPQKWFVCKERKVITDQGILNELRDENNPSVPLKFRNFNSPEVQVAFPEELRANLLNMYAYLPLSETKAGLPFIINGDFIPNLDRTDVIRNLEYNNYLANFAADALVRLFNVVSFELGIDRALTILEQINDSNNVFFQHLNQSFIEKKGNLTIKTLSQEEIPLNNFVIDKSGLFKIFDNEVIRFHNDFSESYVLENLNEKTAEQLEKHFQLRVFDIYEGQKLISSSAFIDKHCKNFKDLLILIFGLSRLPNANGWKAKFANIKILNINNILFSLGELQRDVPEKFSEVLNIALNINALTQEHNDLLNNYPRITELVGSFGLNEFDLSVSLRDLITKRNQFNAMELEHLNMLWCFLYSNKDVTNNDGSKLVNERFKEFPIPTSDGQINELKDCFAGDIENPNNDFSFLYQQYGKDALTKVNVSAITERTQTENKLIINFLSGIHERVRITDMTLFKRAFKQLLKIPHEELAKETEKLVKALLSIFNYSIAYPNENLLEYEIIDFPVLAHNQNIAHLGFTYFDKNYSSYINSEELYADKLYQGIEEISFISKEYLSQCPENDKQKFVDFLKKHFVSPGLKYFKSTIFKISERVNLVSIDHSYQKFNNGYTDFKTNNEFHVFRDITKLSGLHENLVVFWEELSNLKLIDTLTSEISCNGYRRENPFIWLLNNNFEMFPMQGGMVNKSSEIHDKKIAKYYCKDANNLHKCFDEKLECIIDALELKTTLSNSTIIRCLQNLNTFSFEDAEILLLEHFATVTFSPEEVEEINTTCNLLALDKSIQNIRGLVYLEKELEESPIFLESTNYSKNKFVYSFDYNKSYKNTIRTLKIPIKGIEDIELKEVEENSGLDITLVKKVVSDFFIKIIKSASDIELIEKSEFVQCSKIIIGINGVSDFNAQTDSFYDSNQNIYYFIDVRDLAEIICEQYNWPLAENRKLRKLLENAVKSKENKVEQVIAVNNDKFTEEVNEFIKELEGTEWSQHIVELKELLQLDTSLGEQKKKIYNLLAKLKLAKYRNIQFDNVDENNREFNYLEGNGEKYIVHSARGSFAYIAPLELIKMRDDEYLMALDFGNKTPIKIYHKAEDVLRLNTNHLLLYQNDKTMEELFDFCENNQSANKRLLIIDKDHASNKSKELLKLMIPDDEY